MLLLRCRPENLRNITRQENKKDEKKMDDIHFRAAEIFPRRWLT